MHDMIGLKHGTQYPDMSHNQDNNNNNNTGPSGSSQLEGPVERAQKQWREEEERWMREDKELAAKLAAAQLIEEGLAWKVEESRRRQRLDKAERKYKVEKKWRETEKLKGKKRKADKDNEMDKGSIKKRKEVSNKFYIF